MKLTKLVIANIVMPAIMGVIMLDLGTIGCFYYGQLLKYVPCSLVNFIVGATITAIILDLIIYFWYPKFKNKYSISKFYKPTKKNLVHRIGIETLKLREQFQLLKVKHTLEDKRVKYKLVINTFESIYDELLPHAKLILKNTLIPETISALKQPFELLWIRIEGAFVQQELLSSKEIHKDQLYRVDVTAKALDESISKIDLLIDKLIELCRNA